MAPGRPLSARVAARVLAPLFRLVRPLRRVPVYSQLSAAECGAACLRMVLAYHGHHAEPTALRAACGVDRDGTNAERLLRAARQYGLRTSFLTRAEPEELLGVPLPAILHWDFNHFVVLERHGRRGSAVLDPGSGRLRLSPADLSRHFTGLALLFEPSDVFERVAAPSHARFLGLLRGRGRLVLVLLLISVLAQLLATSLPLLNRALLDDVLPGRQGDVLWLLLAGLASVAVVQAAFGYARTQLLLFLRVRLEQDVTTGFVRHLLRVPFAFFEQRSSGEILTSMASNAVLRDTLSERLVSTTLDGAALVAFGVALLVVAPRFGGLVLALGGLRVVLALSLQGRRRALLHENLAKLGKAQARAVEMIHAILPIKASGSEERAFERWQEGFLDQLGSSVALTRLQARGDAASGLLAFLAPVVVLVFAAGQVLAGALSVGEMMGLASLAGLVFSAMLSLTGTWDALQLALTHADRLRDVLDHPPEQPDERPPAPALSGAIEVRALSFRYGRDSAEVLRDVSFDVPAGACVAVVGASGCGKSTLAKLLLGLYPPTSGTIRFDGLSARDMDLRSFRRQIGSVMQDSLLLSGTVRSNIAGGDDAIAPAQIVAAAQLAEIHAEIAAMPMGYDTLVAELGSNLSGGQRQRLALARALVTSPPVLLLDEATSALDAVLEARIHANLERLRVTRVIIAHRISSVRHADLILVLDRGAVAELGTHAALMRRQGRYSELVAAQNRDTRAAAPGQGDST